MFSVALCCRHVSSSTPVVISGVVEHWPAYQKWDMPYLSEKLGDSIVTVDVTPNGFGDAVLLTEEVCDLLRVILHYSNCSRVACLQLATTCPPRFQESGAECKFNDSF